MTNKTDNSIKTGNVVASIAVAAVLWFIMFSPLTNHWVNFWLSMTVSALTLTALSTFLSRKKWYGEHFDLRSVALGVFIAAILWCVFWVGDKLSSLLFSFARPQVDAIYGLKDGENKWLIGALLLFIIGPAEEIFWRGYVQRSLSAKWNANTGFIVSTLIYTLVHIWSFNFMLLMAAMVVGAAWGLLFRFFPKQFPAIIISHAVWDAAVFVLFPI